MENRKSLSTILFAAAIILFVFSTFAMFGKVVVSAGAPVPNMFEAATSGGSLGDARVPGLTTIFVFQMIMLALVVAIIYGTITNKFHYILTIVLFGVLCLLSFISLIISFNAKNLFFAINRSGQAFDYKLGAGPIIYSIMHILGLVSSAAGLLFSRRG